MRLQNPNCFRTHARMNALPVGLASVCGQWDFWIGKMAAAAVVEFQRAQSLISTDRNASIDIFHSIGKTVFRFFGKALLFTLHGCFDASLLGRLGSHEPVLRCWLTVLCACARLKTHWAASIGSIFGPYYRVRKFESSIEQRQLFGGIPVCALTFESNVRSHLRFAKTV